MMMFASQIESLEAQIETALAREHADFAADQILLLEALHLSNEISAKFNSLPRSMMSTGEVAAILQRQSRMLRSICRMQRQARPRLPLESTGTV